MSLAKEDILKEAYLLEMRGKALYQNSIREGMSQELRDLFAYFTKEEETHAALLKEQLNRLRSGQEIMGEEGVAASSLESFSIKRIAAAIDAAGYEGALISAALDFERRAYEYYSAQSASITEAGLKSLYTWLADWERQHMALFAELDREVREKVWYDNNFWPLD